MQPQGNAPEQYIHYKDSFDPTVIPTDSITYNPAIIEESREDGEQYYGITIGMGSSSQNASEKIFLRSWYEPCGQYNGPGEDDTHPTINMEYTYMLLNTLYLPITGTAPNTQFLIPTCEIDTQTGLGGWSQGTADTNLTTVASISGPAVAPSGETVLGKIRLEKRLALPEGCKVQFFDHTVELTNITISGEFVIKVAYAGNAQDDSEEGGISLEDGATIYFDRHNNEYTTANHDPAAGNIRTWYVSHDTDTLIVGKELHWCDVLFNGYGISDSDPMVFISYLGNSEPEDGVQNYLSNERTYFDRHSFGTTKQHPDRTWYARYEGRLNATDKARITVGKELRRGDVFYVDGVRYEIPAIEVLDHDGDRQNGCEKFKYITLRTPLPKLLGDGEYTLGQQYLPCADSQWLTTVEPCFPLLTLPVLPPLNIEHELVDDTDVVLWQPLKLLDKRPYGDICLRYWTRTVLLKHGRSSTYGRYQTSTPGLKCMRYHR